MKPTFICIGVQKSGTGSLMRNFAFHPEIIMSRKEKRFFSRALIKGELTDNDIKGYEKSFGFSNKDKKLYENKFKMDIDINNLVIGEKTPAYSYLKYALERIYNYNKNMKLIIFLREPISRAFSQFNMRYSEENLSDDEIFKFFKAQENEKLDDFKSNGAHHIARGYYDEILEFILSKFPRENLYIGISEVIKNDTLKYYNEIFDFLGVSNLEDIKIYKKNVGNYKKKIPKKLEKYLYNIYKPHNERLYKLLGEKIDIWETYYSEINK